MSSEQIIGLYEKHAFAWDAQRGSQLIENHWLQRFAALLPSTAQVLDVGCGSGRPIAAELARRGFRITGVDSSSSLIGFCRERLPDHEWLVADMRELDLGRRFDGLIAWHSLFHLSADDQRSMFPRLAAHAAPNAALLFTTGPQAGESIGEWQGEPLFHASLTPEEYQDLLARNGFDLLVRKLNDPDCGGASVWLAQMSPASGLDGSA